MFAAFVTMAIAWVRVYKINPGLILLLSLKDEEYSHCLDIAIDCEVDTSICNSIYMQDFVNVRMT